MPVPCRISLPPTRNSAFNGITANRRVDLIHEGVDVAIRVRERLDTDADLQVKRIGVSRRILVASPSLLATTDAP